MNNDDGWLSTENNRIEELLRAANRALRVLSGCNRVLAHSENEDELMQSVCEILVEEGGYCLAWIGAPVEDEEKTVWPIAQCGDTNHYLENLSLSYAETEREKGSTGIAMRTGCKNVVRYSLTDAVSAPWREAAMENGYASSIALPLLVGEVPFTVLNIYSSAPDAFGFEETRLLQELAEDIAFGLIALRTRIAYKRAEHELQQREERLREAEKMQAIGQLAGGIAHDFNNVLCAIVGYASMALEDVPREGCAGSHIEHILQASARAQLLIQQILTFSKQGAGQKHEVFIAPLIEEVVGLLSASLSSSMRVECKVSEELLPVYFDDTKLHEVIMNLSVNAVDAIKDQHEFAEKGLLVLSFEEREIIEMKEGLLGTILPGAYSVISIADNGCGMDGEVQARMFEPFYTTKAVGAGTGMGLAVIFGILKRNKSNMTVESTVGEGTTFMVYIPKVLADI